MPHNTSKNNYGISIIKLTDFDVEKYQFNEVAKMIFMVFDARFTMQEYDNDGEISIIDVNGFSLKHFFKVTASFSTLKLYLKYIQDAAPLRVVQNHFINCSPVIDKLMTLARPFIRKELFDVMHFHKPNTETLYDFVSRDDLPKDYGGNLGTIDAIYNDWIEKVYQKRYAGFIFNFSLNSF